MSGGRWRVVGITAGVLVGAALGVATNVVADAPPNTAAMLAFAGFVAASIVIEIGLRMSVHGDRAEPTPDERGGTNVRAANGGSAVNAGRDGHIGDRIDNRSGLPPLPTIALLTVIVLVAGLVAVLLIFEEDEPAPTPTPTPTAGAHGAGPSPTPSSPRTDPIPGDLVGTWSGGTDGATANWVYTFTADGFVEQANGRIGVLHSGTVVIDGTSMTLHFPGRSPQTFRWQIAPFDGGSGYTFANLMLNGLSYVRQDAEPAR